MGDIVEIISEDNFNRLVAECVESDGYDEFPYKCTVRLPEGMEAHRNVIDAKGEFDHLEEEKLPMIYEDYWPHNYKVISRATTITP